jgi:hypothetical protein
MQMPTNGPGDKLRCCFNMVAKMTDLGHVFLGLLFKVGLALVRLFNCPITQGEIRPKVNLKEPLMATNKREVGQTCGEA